MFTNILWATDGSQQADRALDYAIQIAEHDQTQLHVVEKLVGGRTTGQNASLNESDVLAKIKTQTARAAQAPGITTTLHVVAETTAHVAARIAEIAYDTGADLIVVGTRGHSALGGLFLGSVHPAVTAHRGLSRAGDPAGEGRRGQRAPCRCAAHGGLTGCMRSSP